MSGTDDKDYKKWIKWATITTAVATAFIAGATIMIWNNNKDLVEHNKNYVALLANANEISSKAYEIKYRPYVTILNEEGKATAFGIKPKENEKKVGRVYFWIKNIGDVFAYISKAAVYVADNTAPDDTWEHGYELSPNEELKIRLFLYNAASREGKLTFKIKYKKTKESSEEYPYRKTFTYENSFNKDKGKWEILELVLAPTP